MGDEEVRKRQNLTFGQMSHLFTIPRWIEVGMAKARIQELHLGLTCGFWGPNTWIILHCFPSINRKPD